MHLYQYINIYIYISFAWKSLIFRDRGPRLRSHSAFVDATWASGIIKLVPLKRFDILGCLHIDGSGMLLKLFIYIYIYI